MAAELRGRWQGRTVACIASGPSLTPADVAAVHQAGLPAIAVNTSFRLAPWADVLYGMDRKWWETYHDEIAATFGGVRVCAGRIAARLNAVWMAGVTDFHPGTNSGLGAIGLAEFGGARRALLLGYDGQVSGGRVHWHGDHPRHLGNAYSLPKWGTATARYAAALAARGALDVWNCTRATAFDCWPRVALEDALACLANVA